MDKICHNDAGQLNRISSSQIFFDTKIIQG